MSEIDRVYKLTVIRSPDLRSVAGLDRSFFEEIETITEITDHRIQFHVERHLLKQPNTCDVVITNLSSPTREAFTSAVPMKVRLEAGYENTPRLLFLGDLRFASNEKSGAEWLTKLQLGDGARAYTEARVNRSYAAGTPIITVLTEIVKAFGATLPAAVMSAPELQTRLAAGEAISGYASDEITRILAEYGFEWSFQNGKLQVLRFDQVSPGVVRVLETPPEGGIIGSPVIDPPKIVARPKNPSKKRRVPKLTVQHLLFPELTPGEKCEIRSRSINGTFRLDNVTHDGDSWSSDEWTTTVEATEV